MPGPAYRAVRPVVCHEPMATLGLEIFANAVLASQGYSLRMVGSGAETRAAEISEARRWLVEDGFEHLRDWALMTGGTYEPPNEVRYAEHLVALEERWLADCASAGCGKHNPGRSGCVPCRKAREVARRALELDTHWMLRHVAGSRRTA